MRNGYSVAAIELSEQVCSKAIITSLTYHCLHCKMVVGFVHIPCRRNQLRSAHSSQPDRRRFVHSIREPGHIATDTSHPAEQESPILRVASNHHEHPNMSRGALAASMQFVHALKALPAISAAFIQLQLPRLAAFLRLSSNDVSQLMHHSL